jgi:sulfate/thiosulfate transport system permease protein
MARRRRLPGFKVTMGATLAWLALIVLIPLSREEIWRVVASRRAIAAYQLTFGAAFVAALVNGGVGLLLAWILVRYEFFGKNVLNSLIDIPFALPTAVAGLAYASLYKEDGWLGRFLHPLGIEAVHTRLAVVVVLTFVSLPFVVRAVQPVLEDLGAESEEAAGSLGATRWQSFRWVTFPALAPALLTGVALAFARAVGEYGSVVFVSGNLPMKTEIAPLLIMSQLEQYSFGGAAAIAVVLLLASFAINGAINVLSRWSRRYE